jgi:soluble lytic murein transglycosylase-like protein
MLRPRPLILVLLALVPASFALPASTSHAAGARLTAGQLPYGAQIAATAKRHGIPTPLFAALVWQESGFVATARSRAGAAGLTQLMPATARMLGVRDVDDPVQNLDGGARYLAALLRAFRSKTLGLAGYNAGPGAVRRYRGIPPYAETRTYVRMVLARERHLLLLGLR